MSLMRVSASAEKLMMKQSDLCEALMDERAHNVEKLLYSRRDTAEALSLSVRSVDYLITTRRLPTRRIGGKILIPASAVRRFAREDHPDFVRSPIFSTAMHTKKKPPVSDPSPNRSERLGEMLDGAQRAGTNGRF
jgi:hypothetical protein